MSCRMWVCSKPKKHTDPPIPTMIDFIANSVNTWRICHRSLQLQNQPTSGISCTASLLSCMMVNFCRVCAGTLTFNMMKHLCNSCVTCVLLSLLSKPLNNRKYTNRDLSDLTAIHLWCDCISIHRVRFNLTRSHDPCPMYQVCMCVAYKERKEHARSSLNDFKLT